MLPVVSVSSIRGTGPDGSIVKADIEEYLASGSASKRPSAPEGQKPAVGRAGAAPITEVDYTDIPNTQIRRVQSLILSNRENSNLKEHRWIQLLVSRLCAVP